MRRFVVITLALSAFALAGCGSDDKSADPTTARSTEDEAAPAGGSDDAATNNTATADTGASPNDTVAGSVPPADPTGSGDPTVVTDGPDVIDDTMFDTFPDATDLPPVPTGADMTPELCVTLTGIHEWFEAFDSMDEDEQTWQEVQVFDIERTPVVLQDLEDLAALVPELDETVATATVFIERLSVVIQTASSFEEGTEMLFADEELFNQMMDQGLALEAIDDYAMSECIAP